MKSVRTELLNIKNQVHSLKIDSQQAQKDILKALAQNKNDSQKHSSKSNSSLNNSFSSNNLSSLLKKRPHIDPNLPNLLNEDLFYRKTLPEILGDHFSPEGTLRIASIGKPENLHPFSGHSNVSDMIYLCTNSIANLEFGKFETMAPAMAIKIEERKSSSSSLEFRVHLREDLYWQPLQQEHFPEDLILSPHFLQKHPVTSHDFKFYFDAIMNPHLQLFGAVALRNYLRDIEEFTIIDDLTFSVRWKVETIQNNHQAIHAVKYAAKGLTGHLLPLARFVYQYLPDGSKIIENDHETDCYRNNSVWAQNFSEHWAKHIIPSCGAWIFDGISDERALFLRNPDFYEPHAALTKKVEISFKESPETIWQDFKAGDLDLYEIRPDQLIELNNFLQSEEYQEQKNNGLAIHKIDYVARAYNYIGWNQDSPWFHSTKVRQAMSLAIDRRRIIEQNLNGMGIEISGPFFLYSPSYNQEIKPWPYDPNKARQILEKEGWYDSNGDGTLDKFIDDQRVPFRFRLAYYVKNPTTKANCEYIATALRDIGILCELQGVDITDLSHFFDEKDFDAIYFGWALGTPPEDPEQLWHSFGAKQKGSSNAVGFANTEADDIIKRLQYEYDISKRNDLYHRFHAIIHENAPYTFLYTPKTSLLYRNNIQNVFIPAERQDLIPEANVAEPSRSIFWIKTNA